MTNYALSKYFGFKPYYFGSIQCNNLDRYNKIMSYDDNKILSVKKYADHINSLVFKMKEIVEFYENKTWLFGKTLVDNNIYLNRGKTQIYLEVYASIMYFKCDLIGFLSASSASFLSLLEADSSTIICLKISFVPSNLVIYSLR